MNGDDKSAFIPMDYKAGEKMYINFAGKNRATTLVTILFETPCLPYGTNPALEIKTYWY